MVVEADCLGNASLAQIIEGHNLPLGSKEPVSDMQANSKIERVIC
jgi:hypothetical protein